MGEALSLVTALLMAAAVTAYLLVSWWNGYQSAAYRRQLVNAERLKAEQAIQAVMQRTLAQMFAEARRTAASEDVTPDTRTHN